MVSKIDPARFMRWEQLKELRWGVDRSPGIVTGGRKRRTFTEKERGEMERDGYAVQERLGLQGRYS